MIGVGCDRGHCRTGGWLNRLKALATKRDVPYQSLIKMILAEKLENQAA